MGFHVKEPMQLKMSLQYNADPNSGDEKKDVEVKEYVDGVVRDEWTSFYGKVIERLKESGIEITTVETP